MNYKIIELLKDGNFKRLAGVQRETFNRMLAVIKKGLRDFGRPPKLSRADQLDNTNKIQSQKNAEQSHRMSSVLKDNRIMHWGILLVLLIAGQYIRIKDLNTFQSGDRQFRSAIIARAYYFNTNEAIPEWRKQVAETSRQRAGLLEPPIMELLVSWTYRLVGSEHLWISRFISSLFWVFGGFFLYKIMKQLHDGIVALVSTTYYLFVPTGVYISTGFVPDPLMIMVFVFSILMITQYYDQPSRFKLVTAGVVSALAILVKPFSLFALTGAFISIAISKRHEQKLFTFSNSLTFLGIILLPLIYYVYGVFAGGALLRQAQSSFIPSLLLTRSYWLDWFSTASGVVGFSSLIAALLGFSYMRMGLPSSLLIGLWIGYAIFCLIFSYHIRFGPHYHSQLIVIVALSMGPLFSVITRHFWQFTIKRYRWAPVCAALILVLVVNYRDVRNQLLSVPVSKDIYQDVGEIVDHSTKTVYIAKQYGTPLEYYGELSGTYWPRNVYGQDRALGNNQVSSIDERLNRLDYSPEYFIITHLQEYYTHHPDLKAYLEGNCSLVADSKEYLIYNDCN